MNDLRPLILLRPLLGAALAVAGLTAAAGGDELADAKSAYTEADAALNRLWRGLKSQLSAEEFAKLQASQRDWLRHRDYVADFQMADGNRDDASKRMVDAGYLETAAGLTQARVDYLRSWRDAPATTKTGTWTDSYGGRIDLVEQDGILYFHASCVRGPTFHTGDVAGIAKINESIARFSDRASDPEKVLEDGETWLTFLYRGDGTMTVVGASTGYYHGARAYFDGEYRRTRALDAAAADKVVRAATAPKED